MRHVYSIIRYVPNVASGERVNLGLIAGSDDSREWMLSTVDSKSRTRARQMGGEALPGVLEYLEQLTAELERYTAAQAGGQSMLLQNFMEERTELWLNDLANRQRGAVQFSYPLPVDAGSAEAAINLLWDNLIVEREDRRAPAFKNKHAALGAVRRALRSAGVDAGKVRTATRLESAKYSTYIDFAVYDEKVAFLTNCWSFEVPNKEDLMADIQSWAWTVRSLRDGGGQLAGGNGAGSDHAVPRDVEMSIVYVPPSDDDGRAVLQRARSAFDEVQVKKVVSYEDVSMIIDLPVASVRMQVSERVRRTR